MLRCLDRLVSCNRQMIKSSHISPCFHAYNCQEDGYPPTSKAEGIAPDFKQQYELAKMPALHPCLSCAAEKWSDAEDQQLRKLKELHGGAWTRMAEEIQGRNRSQCVQRWETLSRQAAAAAAGVQPALVCMCI